MSCFTRSVLRWGLIGGLALGGLTLLVGPERVAAGFAQVRSKAQETFDSKISDPVALRRQLAPMQEQYEKRLRELKGEIAAVEHQIQQYDYDIEVARRTIALANDDLSQLKVLVERAETEVEQTTRPVSIRFGGVRFNIDQAYNEARRINTVRQTFHDRLASDEQQMVFLAEQLGRLRAIHDELETEYTQFQAQLWQLERQIDSIERNDRLIELTQQHQATLASYERMGKVGNLKQLEGKLAQLRAIQEAQLQALEHRGLHRDYESRAKREVGRGGPQQDDPFGTLDRESSPAGDHRDNGRANRSMVWSAPKIIE